MQDESEQRPHKISYRVSATGAEAEALVQEVEAKLRQEGLSAKLIYSAGADLDILPQGASKGKGLEFLLGEVGDPGSLCQSAIGYLRLMLCVPQRSISGILLQ